MTPEPKVLPLAGRHIVVTRPRAQAGPLAEAIQTLGGVPHIWPLLAIAPADDSQALNLAAARLATYRVAVFISPNAVQYAVPALLAVGPWPSGVLPAAVGPGTVKALAGYGVGPVLVPAERFDSEALLALPELAPARVAGQQVLILRGDGGRELLADTLRARGASVDCVTCYRRSGPAEGFATWLSGWQAGQVDAITVSSSEGLRYLIDGLSPEGRAYLQRTPVFVPHARIAETARAAGVQQVVLTGPADAGLLEGLRAYNWSA